MRLTTVDRQELETWVKRFNCGLSKFELDVYLSKKHLLDYVDGYLSELIEKYELNITS